MKKLISELLINIFCYQYDPDHINIHLTLIIHVFTKTYIFRQTRVLGRYLLELALQDYNLLQFRPSALAQVALDQADRMLGQKTRMGELTASGHPHQLLAECANEFQSLVDQLLTNNLDIQGVLEKYSTPIVYGSQDDRNN